MTRAFVVAAMFVLTLTGQADAQTPIEIPFAPVDEAPKDPELVAFRTRLLEIVERHDLERLLAVTSPNVMYSFSEGPGIVGFRKFWQLDDPTSEFWAELKQVLSLGGSFQGPDIFIAPYVHSRWPDDLDEAADFVAVVRSGTAAYTEPDLSATVVRRLEPVIVETEYDEKLIGRWHRLRLVDGQKAYIPHADARRAIDLRAFFSRSPTGWLMVICVAGD